MKGLKTGGRQSGTPNKSTTVVSKVLDGSLNLVDEAMSLYESGDNEFKLRVLSLLFPYVYPKRVERPSGPSKESDVIDITPENEMQVAAETLDYIKQKFPQLITPKDE